MSSQAVNLGSYPISLQALAPGGSDPLETLRGAAASALTGFINYGLVGSSASGSSMWFISGAALFGSPASLVTLKLVPGAVPRLLTDRARSWSESFGCSDRACQVGWIPEQMSYLVDRATGPSPSLFNLTSWWRGSNLGIPRGVVST